MTTENASQTRTAAGQPAQSDSCGDLEFILAVEALAWPAGRFRHREHVRLAWLYASRLPPEAAAQRMCATIRALAAHYGAGTKFHVTMSLAWMRLVLAAVRVSLGCVNFEEFAVAHPELLDARLLENYFSAALLSSEEARLRWVEPDLRALP